MLSKYEVVPKELRKKNLKWKNPPIIFNEISQISNAIPKEKERKKKRQPLALNSPVNKKQNIH